MDAAGWDPAPLIISVFAFKAKNDEVIRRYRDMGIDRTVMITPRWMDHALRGLDQKQPFVAELK